MCFFAWDKNHKRPNLHKYKMAATLFANYQIMPHNFGTNKDRKMNKRIRIDLATFYYNHVGLYNNDDKGLIFINPR